MGRNKSKRKSPSREKYERNNPVASFRMSKKLGDKAREAKEKMDLSNRDIFEIGLGLLEPKIRAEEEVRQEAYEKGWEAGIKEAEELYAVTYNCRRCGKRMWVTSDGEKRAIKGYMWEGGWGHGNCSNP